jgi:hypothetical protein
MVSIFSCVFWPFEFLLLRKLCLVQLFISLWFIDFEIVYFFKFLYVLVISPLADVQLASIFFYSVDGLFSLENISFVVQKLFSFMKSYLSILFS